MYGYIYRITDLTNGKCYIGQHKYDKPVLDPKYHGSSYILRNQIKAHPERFLEELLMICATLEEANYFETYFIEHMNTIHPNGYNLNNGGNIHKPTKEVREKISKANKGRKQTKEEIERRVEKMRGRKHSQETKRKMSESAKGKHIGQTPWNKGIKRTDTVGEKNGRYKKICPLLIYKYLYIDKLKTHQICSLLNITPRTLYKKIKEHNIKDGK